MRRPTKVTPELIEAYLEHLIKGHTQIFACQKLGVARQTMWKLRKKDPAFATAEAEVLNTRSELVEDALYQNALKGNVIAQIFWLKNRDHRRWKDRHEVAHDVANPTSLKDLVKGLDERNDPALVDPSRN